MRETKYRKAGLIEEPPLPPLVAMTAIATEVVKSFVVRYRCLDCRCDLDVEISANARIKVWRYCNADFILPVRRCRGVALIREVRLGRK